MSKVLLGSGGVLNAGQISRAVEKAPPGRVQLSLDMRYSPAAGVVNTIRNTLVSRGVPGVQVGTGSPILNISWLKDGVSTLYNEDGISEQISMAPITAIAIIIAAIAIIAIVVLGWRVYSDIPDALKGPFLTGIGILALASLIAFTVYKVRNK